MCHTVFKIFIGYVILIVKIMGQKPIYVIVAIAVALLFTGVVTSGTVKYARAAYTQHAIINPLKCIWSKPGFGCDYCTDNDCSNAFVVTPHIQQVAFFPVDDGCNGHWAFSFPARCLPN
ncbi:MAG: hypothetical protein WAK17_18025 [Candidatus Nitrosopolaris sp.]